MNCIINEFLMLFEADVMRSGGTKHILAIDGSSSSVKEFSNYGDDLSELRLLLTLRNWSHHVNLKEFRF